MPKSVNEESQQKTKINLETALIAWSELQRFFAAGQCVYVAPELDLVGVAYRIANDEVEQIQTWMAEEQLIKVTDEQAKTWLEEEVEVWSVVVKPWVLVQPRADSD